MLTDKELNPNQIVLGEEHRANFFRHYHAMNELVAAYGRELVVTSGVRARTDQIRIYAEINARRRLDGMSDIEIPWGSSHLKAAATDFLDPDMAFYRWCEAHKDHLERLGIYVEYRRAGDGEKHTHLQTIAPKSGNRFFRA